MDLTAIKRRLGSEAVFTISSTGKRELLNVATAEVARNAVVVAKLPEKPTWEKKGATVECRLPYRLSGADGELDLVPFLVVAGGAVEYRPDRGPYEARVQLVVRREGAGAGKLSSPAWFMLRASVGAFTPNSVRIEKTGEPYDAALAANTVDGDTVELTVVPGREGPEEAVTVSVTVRRPVIRIAAPARIQGFGLQSCAVDVATDHPAVSVVHLATSAGALESANVKMDGSGNGATRLFSSGLGTAEISVVNPGLKGEIRRVDLVFPFAFLLAAVVGGMAGGLYARYRASRKRTVPHTLLRGALTGLIAAVGLAFGVNLLSIDLAKVWEGRGFTEGLVFLAAALAAAFGLLRPGEAKARKA
ncbi:MAG TPA: hypothetical protein VFY93_00075 [Planctomycetota bacterium]|nr:hypothetical protein [Planctomycetota bacterium]